MKIDTNLAPSSAGRRPARPWFAAHVRSRVNEGVLDFVVPTSGAAAMRTALAGRPGYTVRSCTPHPTRREVAIRIVFPAGAERELMRVLLASVPAGEFGRIAWAADAHRSARTRTASAHALQWLMLAAGVLVAAGLLGPAAHAQERPGRPEEAAHCMTEALDTASAGLAIAAAEKWRTCHTEEAQRRESGMDLLQGSLYVPIRHRLADLAVQRGAQGSAHIRGELQGWHAARGGASLVSYGTWEAELRQTPAGWRIASERVVPAATTSARADR